MGESSGVGYEYDTKAFEKRKLKKRECIDLSLILKVIQFIKREKRLCQNVGTTFFYNL